MMYLALRGADAGVYSTPVSMSVSLDVTPLEASDSGSSKGLDADLDAGSSGGRGVHHD